MTLLITEAEVRSLLTMPVALEVVEASLREQGEGRLVLQPRRRLPLPEKGQMHYMAASDPVLGYFGMKVYTVVHGAARFVVPLFRGATGEMAALVEADALGQLRTGAASGVATKYLANSNARSAGIIGTGYQARTQLEAVAAVRRLERACAYSRDPERRTKFCREMSARIGVLVEPATSCEEVVRGADIVITATPATQIVLEGAWLAPGTHVIAMGSNWPQKRELDAEAVRRSDVVAVDWIEQAKMEAGDLIQAFGENSTRWDSVRELSVIVAGKTPGRTDSKQITLFKSVGIAAWDVAAAARVYELAIARGMGESVPLWEEDGSKD